MKNRPLRSMVISCMASSFFLSSIAYAGKSVSVHRKSGAWMGTVLEDALYGSILGGLGYGAYGLISKKYKGSDLATSVGVGFIVGTVVGIFDATITDSSALIQYNNSSKQFAFSVPKTQIVFSNDYKNLGAEMKLLNVQF